ncbi:hypothetical protein GGX14DRAFT_666851 [Mycena pura]|uniref:Uncharacterized protein n=1 Tax=Mycena pura TaxID=153505 RepID=A0AAD6V2G2_9AGAR|nr:hypothetical protein GGX14DRAFT_666851 [Mycena pura]
MASLVAVVRSSTYFMMSTLSLRLYHGKDKGTADLERLQLQVAGNPGPEHDFHLSMSSASGRLLGRALTQRSSSSSCCQKYNAGVAKAGGLGRNHELRSADPVYRSPSPRDPGRDTENQIVEQSQQATQAKSVSKHEWLQSPSPQDSKIAKERWGAVNELNSHTVRQRCIQYSMRQYMVGPEFLTQATPERLGERIERAGQRETFPRNPNGLKRRAGRMTKGIMDSGGNGAGSQKEQCRNNSNRYAEEGCRACRKGFAHSGIDGLRVYIDVEKKRRGNAELREASRTRRRMRRTSRKRIGMCGEGWLDQQKRHRAEIQLKMLVMRR